MPDIEHFGNRIFAGLMAYQAVHGRTSLDVVGERVARLEGRKKGPYSKGAVSDWIGGKSEPSLATFVAIARLFGGMPSWYAFNFGEAPSNPIAEAAKLAPAKRAVKRRVK